ncbi:MAG: type II toxin-antitoxin system VapC family toxin [Planctomycetota bacterium]
MIILDTNVVSEVMRSEPNQAVLRWLDRQPASSLWVTAITCYEVEFGIHRLAKGRRRDALERGFQALVAEDLGGRVLALDASAALAAGAVGAALQAEGRTVDVRDLMITGIARVRQATVATRNVADFEDACEVVNPWDVG